MSPKVTSALLLLALSASLPSVSATTSYEVTCQKIAGAISPASNVYYPSMNFNNYSVDIFHAFLSSSQNATCSVEPGTAADVGVILQIVGSTRTPFAVKGGGHASNPGFSSTPGVQIAMTRFSEVAYDASSQSVAIGAGVVWDDAYAALEPYNVSVVGGRSSGVGVAGFTLGGGYSWKTNQYGLGIDSVLGYELVLPNGTCTTVTPTSYPDLFFGLRGGYNNFGIVTKFVMNTYPQTAIWGWHILVPWTSVDAVTAATYKFSEENTDPKANIITLYSSFQGVLSTRLSLFYDAPSPPPGLFDDFLAIPPASTSNSTFSTTLGSMTAASPGNNTAALRAAFATISLTGHSVALLKTIEEEMVRNTKALASEGAMFIAYNAEPFLPSIFSHNTSPSAYPPIRTQALLPLEVSYGWLDPSKDQIFYDAIRSSVALIKAQAISEGQDIADAPIYGNYALFDTPLKDIYGANVKRLKSIKKTYDPHNVTGLAGGFKF